jgi:hypothetical protein
MSVLMPLLLAALLPAADGRGEKAAATAPAGDRVPVAMLAGVVQDTGADTGTLGLRVTLRYLEPNVGAQQEYARRSQELMRRQAAALRNLNLAQRQQQLAQVLQDAQRLMATRKDLFHVREKIEDVNLPLADDVRVRSAQPPQPFDDKGNIRLYTPQEWKDLRGTEGLPGYRAERSDLQPGQHVLVRVAVRRKPAPPTPPASPGESASVKTSPPPPPPADEKDSKPVVVLIVIADLMK